MKKSQKKGQLKSLRRKLSGFPSFTGFAANAADLSDVIGYSTSWDHILRFQESSGNITTDISSLTATASGLVPPTYTISYGQSGPVAGHSSIELSSTLTLTTAKFLFANAAIEPGASSFAVLGSFYINTVPGGTWTLCGIETGSDYWALRVNDLGRLLFLVFDGSLSNTATLSHDHRGSWTDFLLILDQGTDTLYLETNKGGTSVSGVSLGAINSASRGLAVGSTASPVAKWAYFAYTDDITGLVANRTAIVSNFRANTGGR